MTDTNISKLCFSELSVHSDFKFSLSMISLSQSSHICTYFYSRQLQYNSVFIDERHNVKYRHCLHLFHVQRIRVNWQTRNLMNNDQTNVLYYNTIESIVMSVDIDHSF